MAEANAGRRFRRWLAGPYASAMDSARAVRITARLLLFLGATVVLVVVCRQGSSLFQVGLAFSFYVAAITLWVRGQHQASVDAVTSGKAARQPWTPPYLLSLGAVGVGLLLFGLWGLWLDSGTALLAGALGFYLGSGYALMRFRTFGRRRRRRYRGVAGVAVLICSAILVRVGLLFMEDYPWTVFLFGGGLLIAPAGLTMLAGPAVEWLRKRPGGNWRTWRNRWVGKAAAVGAGLLFGSAGIAFARAGSPSILIAFGALALLVLAVVSSTQADIAAVIAIVALMGVTSVSENKPDDLVPKAGEGQRLLVALGDSYMSGEGAQIFYEEEADAAEKGNPNQCHRAPTAWAALAGQSDLLFDSVAFLACSGADTNNVRHQRPLLLEDEKPSKQGNEPGTQLDQVNLLKQKLGVKDLEPSLVVISLGGNNAGFSTIGAMCIAPGDCSDEAKLWEETLDQVSRELTATYKEVRAAFRTAPVLVTAYPLPIYAPGGNVVKCEQAALSKKDLQFINTFLPKLNATVKEAALKEEGFFFLDKMAYALANAHLQLCDPDNDGRPGVNFIGLRSVGGVAEQRFNPQNWYHNSLHPNARGHAAMLEVFQEWRAGELKADPAVVEVEKPPDATKEPLCDLSKVKGSTTPGCRDLGTKWMLGQVSNKLVAEWWVVLFAMGALGAWLLGIAFYAWWKPWWTPAGPALPATGASPVQTSPGQDTETSPPDLE